MSTVPLSETIGEQELTTSSNVLHWLRLKRRYLLLCVVDQPNQTGEALVSSTY